MVVRGPARQPEQRRLQVRGSPECRPFVSVIGVRRLRSPLFKLLVRLRMEAMLAECWVPYVCPLPPTLREADRFPSARHRDVTAGLPRRVGVATPVRRRSSPIRSFSQSDVPSLAH
jgi:hypothetical protein